MKTFDVKNNCNTLENYKMNLYKAVISSFENSLNLFVCIFVNGRIDTRSQ